MGIKRVLSCHPIKLLGGGSSLDFVPSKNTLKKENSNG
jgi:putative component of membrane protein insertase Oxa1/YidC/SpoIIIJ protein YidD